MHFGLPDKTKQEMRPYNALTYPYFLILKLRNMLYDRNIIKSYKPSIPSIGLGNITVGGTGKTPHCEMILRLLSDKYRTAVVSRGYGRKTKGLREVDINDSPSESGDEPLQIKRKFPGTRVIVSESRIKAVRMLENEDAATRPQLIVFDDILQHRKITSGNTIVLIDYNRPSYKDTLLPFGRLRDIPASVGRANNAIITKMPEEYVPTDEETGMFRKEAGIPDDCGLFFTSIRYGNPEPVFRDCFEKRYVYSNSAVYFSAIADDLLFKSIIRGRYRITEGLKFKDHRRFGKKEIRKIARLGEKHPEAVIITTEKDMVRICGCDIPDKTRMRMFYIPIRMELQRDTAEFLKAIDPEMR